MKIEAEKIKDDIIKWRRHLHQYPELSFQEVETSNYIYDVLKSFEGIELTRPTKTSVVGLLKGGLPGKTVALRADIDGLPVESEQADVDFKSKIPGVMHSCGHDTHTAILLGAAKILSAKRGQLAGNVKFIFQHAEEMPPGGAVEMVKAGVMDGVDMVFGLHIMPNLKTGSIGIREGAVSAGSDVAVIVLKGKGSHGSTPELSIDPITMGAQIVSNLNNIVARNVSPFANVVISVGEFCAGKAANVIPDTARLQLSIRTNDKELRLYVKKRIEEVVDCVTKMYGGSYDMDYMLGYSAVINSPDMVDLVKAAAEKVVGNDMIFEPAKAMGGEDFSAFLEKAKGAYFILGGGTEAEGCCYQNHHPKFKIDECALPTGTQMFVELVMDIIGK